MNIEEYYDKLDIEWGNKTREQIEKENLQHYHELSKQIADLLKEQVSLSDCTMGSKCKCRECCI